VKPRHQLQEEPVVVLGRHATDNPAYEKALDSLDRLEALLFSDNVIRLREQPQQQRCCRADLHRLPAVEECAEAARWVNPREAPVCLADAPNVGNDVCDGLSSVLHVALELGEDLVRRNLLGCLHDEPVVEEDIETRPNDPTLSYFFAPPAFLKRLPIPFIQLVGIEPTSSRGLDHKVLD